MASHIFCPKERVRIRALVSRPELNGQLARVLKPLPDEAAKLNAEGRVKVIVSSGSHILSVRATNLEHDWGFSLPHCSTDVSLQEIATSSPAGDHDACDAFSAAVGAALTGSAAAYEQMNVEQRDFFFSAEVVPDMLAFCTKPPVSKFGRGHYIHILTLDAIGHHCVLDVFNNAARLFQSYIKDNLVIGFEDNPTLMRVPLGYTAREWASPMPVAGWRHEQCTAHARWGGCRNISPPELRELLALLVAAQDAAGALADELELPPELARAEDAWFASMNAKIKAATRKNPSPDFSPSPLTVWASQRLEELSTGGVSLNNHVLMSNVSEQALGRPAAFAPLVLPSFPLKALNAALCALTGVSVNSPAVVLKVLMFRAFRNLSSRHPHLGGPKANSGWGMRIVFCAD